MKSKKSGGKKDLTIPTRVGLLGLALLIGLAERGAVTLAGIFLKSPRELKKSLREIEDLPTLTDYYEELKKAKIESIRTILWRLRQKGLIEKREQHYILSNLGIKFLKESFKQEKKNPEWDKKWRLITFDIPEEMRKERDWLRYKLIENNYRSIQKSVFLGKFPLKEEVYKEIHRRQILPHTRLIVIGEIDDDSLLEEKD